MTAVPSLSVCGSVHPPTPRFIRFAKPDSMSDGLLSFFRFVSAEVKRPLAGICRIRDLSPHGFTSLTCANDIEILWHAAIRDTNQGPNLNPRFKLPELFVRWIVCN